MGNPTLTKRFDREMVLDFSRDRVHLHKNDCRRYHSPKLGMYKALKRRGLSTTPGVGSLWCPSWQELDSGEALLLALKKTAINLR